MKQIIDKVTTIARQEVIQIAKDTNIVNLDELDKVIDTLNVQELALLTNVIFNAFLIRNTKETFKLQSGNADEKKINKIADKILN